MSTLEIAEITGKSHKHVKADTRDMFKRLNLRSADFSADRKDRQKQEDGRSHPFNLSPPAYPPYN